MDSVVPFAYGSMAAETRSILGALGVEIDWTRARPGDTSRDEMRVILLNSDAARAGLSPRTMGAAVPHEPRARSVWVYYPNLTRALGLNRINLRAWSVPQRYLFARALGRVVAHELVHALLPDQPHTQEGLMSRSLDTKMLLSPQVEVGSELGDSPEKESPEGALSPH
jgi:hypothetical protein